MKKLMLLVVMMVAVVWAEPDHQEQAANGMPRIKNALSQSGRVVVPLTGAGWRFAREDAAQSGAATERAAEDFDDRAWAEVEVPHDWAIAGPFLEQGAGTGKLPWKGAGWYRRAVEIPAETIAAIRAGGAAWLEFDGVMASPQVFINGQLAGGWDYGYMSFRVDAAPWLKAGRNVVAVRADTRAHGSRWYPGAGIYRAVRLVTAPAVHVAAGSVRIGRVSPGHQDGGASAKGAERVRVELEVTNRLERAVKAGVEVRIGRDRALPSRVGTGHQDAGALEISLKAGEGKAVELEVEIAEAKLWDVEAPNLYMAETRVTAEGKTDAVQTRFGIRTFEWTADDGFHLNGRRVQLRGVNLHSDLGMLGMAFNRSAMRRQLELIREMGANAVRTSHNAPDPALLDLCDEMGLLVWDECFDKWEETSGRRPEQDLEEYVTRNLRAFVRRDRNHPCVVAWSIGNEILPRGYNWSDEYKGEQESWYGMTRARCRLFREAVRAEDTTRPVGIGCCHTIAVGLGIFDDLDLTGWNYSRKYAPMKEKYPGKPVVYTESASAFSSNGFYMQPPPVVKTHYATNVTEVCSYDRNSADWSDIPDVEFDRMERDRYCAGEFVWTGIDYLGEPSPYMPYTMKGLSEKDSARSSYFGIVDLAGIPKDRYWLYRAYWRPEAFTAHLVPHWNWEGAATVPVFLYTNGDEAELFVNGRSQGRRVKGQGRQTVPAEYYAVCDKYRLMWDAVPYEPGEVRAVVYRGGKKIGETAMRTAGKAARVRLTPEAATLPADGESVVFVRVEAVDAAGVRDPRAANRMRFSIAGPGRILAVGNGNPHGNEAFTAPASHPLYFGNAVAVVRRDKGAAGAVTLTVESDGLEPAQVVFGE